MSPTSNFVMTIDLLFAAVFAVVVLLTTSFVTLASFVLFLERVLRRTTGSGWSLLAFCFGAGGMAV